MCRINANPGIQHHVERELKETWNNWDAFEQSLHSRLGLWFTWGRAVRRVKPLLRLML